MPYVNAQKSTDNNIHLFCPACNISAGNVNVSIFKSVKTYVTKEYSSMLQMKQEKLTHIVMSSDNIR